MEEIRLTSFSSYGGCGAKLPAEYLDIVMHRLKKDSKDDILDLETMEDASVLEINDDLNILHTIDYFTPIVDDPYVFGQIVATNALNDIYAMGGIPTTALNLVEFPLDCLDLEVLAQIMKGGQDKTAEAGAKITGGHTLRGSGLKYGMAVLGMVKPEDMCRNSNAKVGDTLILTKPLGVGVIATALKRGVSTNEGVEKACKYMTQLNKESSEAMKEVGANACTDITGFGLVGHALEMARGSGVGINIDSAVVPCIEEAIELVENHPIDESICTNKNYFSRDVVLKGLPSKVTTDLLFSAETAGGLLISISSNKADALLDGMKNRGVGATPIGEVIEDTKSKINIS